MINRQYFKKVSGTEGKRSYDTKVAAAYAMIPHVVVRKNVYEVDGARVERVTSENRWCNSAYTMVQKDNGERTVYIQITMMEVA